MQRQADIDYEKAERALAQAKLDYKTKTEQAKAKMREVGADLDRQKNKVKVDPGHDGPDSPSRRRRPAW